MILCRLWKLLVNFPTQKLFLSVSCCVLCVGSFSYCYKGFYLILCDVEPLAELGHLTETMCLSGSVVSDSLQSHGCRRSWESPPGSSVHGILQARILEWVAIPFTRGSSWPWDRTRVSCNAGKCFTNWATREAQHKQYSLFKNDSAFFFFRVFYYYFQMFEHKFI